MPMVAGAIKKVTLDGVTFTVAGDANITEVGSRYENSVIPTSGDNMRKMVKRAETREGVTLIIGGRDRELLRTLADRTTDFPMSYETAAGDIYRATGWIEFENRETEENRATIKMFPRQEWSAFLA